MLSINPSQPKTQIKPRFMPPALALRTVISKGGFGVYASSDSLLKGAVFGRDSLEVAEDLMTIKPRLVKKILRTLASLQGEVMSDRNEEAPGKIIHEYRTAVVDGRPLDDVSRHVFQQLSARWGGNDDSLAYYGSIDATPHFIRVLATYCHHHGDKILNEKIMLRSGHMLRMRITAENALDWLTNQLEHSGSGLLEYQRRQPLGLANQVWKDSKEFYTHASGLLANHDRPIASIEVQGLAYDALLAGARFLLPTKAEELIERAKVLQQRLLKLLWLPDREYFGLGIDYDDSGQLRIITTATANPAALLDSAIFDDLPATERQFYVASIVEEIMGSNFLTDAGVRSRSLAEANLVPYWDYHGSYTSWPKETYDIAKGLRRHGLSQLARQLENRLLNIVLRFKNYPEFVYVDGQGRVLASAPSQQAHGEVILVDGSNQPESIQAWTVSAIMAIVAYRISSKFKRPAGHRPSSWQSALEKQILAKISRINRLFSGQSLRRKYPSYPYQLVDAVAPGPVLP